jgi:hypothetical protein
MHILEKQMQVSDAYLFATLRESSNTTNSHSVSSRRSASLVKHKENFTFNYDLFGGAINRNNFYFLILLFS